MPRLYSPETKKFHKTALIVAIFFTIFWLYAKSASGNAGLAGGAVAGSIMLLIMPFVAATGAYGFYAVYNAYKKKEPLLVTIMIALPFWYLLYYFLSIMMF